MRLRIALLLLPLLGWVGALGCNNDSAECEDSPFVGSWAGPASFTGTATGAPSGLSGSATLHVSTGAPSCGDPAGAKLVNDGLTFELGPRCVLGGARTSTHTVPHCQRCGEHPCCTEEFVDGTASASGSSCELPLGNGAMIMVVQDGTVHVTASGAFDATLSGPLVDWSGTPQSGFVTVHFESASPGF